MKPIEIPDYDQKLNDLAAAFAKALEVAIAELPFDVRCLDWFSYNPDFHREQYYRMQKQAA